MTCMFCGIAGLPVCLECHRSTGVRPMPPMRREVSPCKRCNHAKLIRVIPRELSVASTRSGQLQDNNNASYGPMYATYPAKTGIQFNMIAVNRVVAEPPQAHEGYGLFETYICKRCGFAEWFCHDPENIPIGPQFMTEEIDSDSSGPYR